MKYKKNAMSLDKEELKELFEDANFRSDHDSVKVALLYFLIFGLIRFPRKSKIDMKLVKLVKDLDRSTTIHGETLSIRTQFSC